HLVNRLLLGPLCNGHLLIEGVPGLAKTLAVKTLSDTIEASFKRLQFTPDLLPADLNGTMIYNPADQTFRPRLGPIFTDILLADEINRAPPKVQSALLEAMQEKQVSIGGTTHPLGELFMVLATQNPIEHEGTYRLPEAQVDRFMMKVVIGYPSQKEEREIMDRQTSGVIPEVRRVATPKAVLDARAAVRQVHMEESLKDYVVRIVFATREPGQFGLDELKPLISFGVSPRASIFISLAARANAFLEVREYEPGDDIRSIDWNVTARMGTPYIKKFREDRELNIFLAVDSSASSWFGSVAQSKRELGAEVAALLTLTALKNNDRVGLLRF